MRRFSKFDKKSAKSPTNCKSLMLSSREPYHQDAFNRLATAIHANMYSTVAI